MTAKDHTLQVCPTRVDGSRVLFAHRVDTRKCQERQRQRYHKCFTCAWNNSYVSLHGAPVAEPTPDTKEETTAV
ncbi:MAG: hypothetical protein ACI9F9_003469 [Candidatus Paceibacteria bacterium]|jgi:hypothetical protein